MYTNIPAVWLEGEIWTFKLDGNSDEMNVNLNMFCSLVLNRIGGHVDQTDVVAVPNSGFGGRWSKLMEEIAEPTWNTQYPIDVMSGIHLSQHPSTQKDPLKMRCESACSDQ